MEMTIKQVFSRHVDKDKLNIDDVVSIQETLRFFNNAKIKIYNWQYDKLFLKKNPYGADTPFVHLKNYYGINDYYANSILNTANGVLDSQKKTHKLNTENLEARIKKAEKKLKETKKKIENKEKILNSIIECYKGKKKKISFYKGSIEGQDGSKFVVRYKNNPLEFSNLYDFENIYLKPEIKKLKNRLYRIIEKVHRMNNKLNKLEKKFRGATFGSKDLFKNQFTVPHYVKKHNRWKEDFYKKRYFTMTISGRKDAKYGNFIFSYDPTSKDLKFSTHTGKEIIIKNLEFPYGQECLNNAINYRKQWEKPIAWTIEDHGKYYIFKATVYVPKTNINNFSKAAGIVSVDLNYDHVAWADLNKEGNLLDFGTIPMNLEGLTSGQATKIIENAMKQVVDIALSKNKPIGREELDTEKSKASMQYENKKRNKKISQFAYSKIIESIDSRANKMGVAIFSKNPAYTSQIGKIKYMKQKGLSIHVSAAYVIGRRNLGIKDKLPKDLKPFLSDKQIGRHHWSHWSYVSKTLKEVRTHMFYNVKSKERQLAACNDLKQYKKVLES